VINLKQLRISEEDFACKKPPNRYRVLRCTQNLYKSTYKGNAFKKGHTYFIHPDPTAAKGGLVYVVDETGYPFSFAGEGIDPKGLYQLGEFFDLDHPAST